jgi:hypothetical protein
MVFSPEEPLVMCHPLVRASYIKSVGNGVDPSHV